MSEREQLKVTCPSCGHVRLDPADVRLVVATPQAYYLFRCPGCDRRVRRPAASAVVAALAGRGVPTVRPVPAAGHGSPAEGPGTGGVG